MTKSFSGNFENSSLECEKNASKNACKFFHVNRLYHFLFYLELICTHKFLELICTHKFFQKAKIVLTKAASGKRLVQFLLFEKLTLHTNS